ncbi:MAG: hypothetical protein KDM91_21895 [Verrucomicrobiae bacterium]|nr:hypothetical protein [Verrucomicrobiae bacterium]MCP5538601.1 hypothetical protein [Akkermansiaceae bacterium]
MNTLLFEPTDVLFFRDGRPMGGSLSGHGAAWPLPTVVNAALHAALWRADLDGVHSHGHDGHDGVRIRMFGSLLTAGPFPVLKSGEWLFPRPLDTGVTEKTAVDSTAITFQPLKKGFKRAHASLPEPLQYPVAATLTPTKATPSPWWTKTAWESYLKGDVLLAEKDPEVNAKNSQKPVHFHKDAAFSETEFTYGIGMSPDTGVQDGERFYSAHYLRLKPDCRLGLLADCQDKGNGDPKNERDLIEAVFPNSGAKTPIIVGGQQRACTVRRECSPSIPLPRGKSEGLHDADSGKYLVKWALLTPAIFPEINEHKGGWLPSWVRRADGKVMLKSGDASRREREGRDSWRKRIAAMPEIAAQLVAANVDKPILVSGYALPHEANGKAGGPKPTHLAVPAGSVYYFACESESAAKDLANALNWHGAGEPDTIRNRRSTLLGEKGFGLGVCGTWRFHIGKLPGTRS